MVPRPRRFDERALLYIGLPAFLIILATMGVVIAYAAMYPSLPTWVYYGAGGFIAVVVLGAALVTLVAYIGTWLRGAAP